jgi:hypothetical protein
MRNALPRTLRLVAAGILLTGLGYVFAVTSRRTTSGTPTLLSTPNSADVKTMFDLMTT